MWKDWTLPTCCDIEGEVYPINSDYRDILAIIALAGDPDLEEEVKALAALHIFFAKEIPPPKQGVAAMMDFIACGAAEEQATPAPRLLDWQQDYLSIAADINRVAGREVRAMPYLHWFTFVGYFEGIGEGVLSQLVGIRKKLCKGEKLLPAEREFYTANRGRVELKTRYSQEEQVQINRFLAMMEKKGG